MKIYTGFGDAGNTQLLGGQTVPKNDIRVCVCGTLDELNAVLGMVASSQLPSWLAQRVAHIQSDLFRIGCMVAAVGSDSQRPWPEIAAGHATRLEQEIDRMQDQLSPLTNFLLPGGAPAAAGMHLARSVCRRGERLVTDLVEQYADFQAANVFRYLNRLSDWCFVAARLINQSCGVSEPIWKGDDDD